jgi:uncharacterized membrane protein YccC
MGTSWLRRPDPLLTIDLLQQGKAALAGAVAWVVAAEVLGLEQPFLAPWAAVLVVQSTVYRTVSRGGQQVAATFAGVLLAWATGRLLGVGFVAMATLLVVAFLVGRNRWLRDEATTIATTGIVVLATNAAFQVDLLASRLIDTTVGVVVGLLVNLIVWPPLRDRAAWARADALPDDLAEVLAEIAGGLGPDLEPAAARMWTRQLRRVDLRIDEAWRLLGEAQESSRLNPRRSRPEGLDDQRRNLHLLEQAVADTMSMARTLAMSAENATRWDVQFRSALERLLQDTADAVRKNDTEGLRDIRSELDRIAEELSTDSLAASAWQEYGGMLMNLRNMLAALTRVIETGHRLEPTGRRGKRYPSRGRGAAARFGRRVRGYSHRDGDTSS